MNISPTTPDLSPPEGEAWIGDRAPDPELFFNGPAHARLLELLRHLTENTADVALVVGPQGAGKTTLLFQFQGLAPEHWALCRVDANPMLHPDQLLNRLARHVDAPHSDDPVPETLASAFAALRLQGRLPVVVVDDAEQLPISSLLLLMRLHERRAETLPICALILLADPAIDAILASRQLHAMGTARFQRLEMPQLTAEQTPDYVRHFLRMEGVQTELALSAAHLARIQRDSEGVPGRINEQVIRILREPANRGDRAQLPPVLRVLLKRLRALPPMQAGALGGLTLLLLLGLVFQDGINRLFVSPEPSDGADGGSPTLAARQVQPLALPPKPAPRDAGTLRTAPRQPEPARETGPDSEPLIPPPASLRPHTVPGEIAAPRPSELPVTPEPVAVKRTPPVSVPPPGPEMAEAPAPRTTEPVSPAPAPAAPTEPPRAANPPPRIRDRAWLMKRPAEQWTVQILAAGSETALHRFIERHGPKGPLAWFQTRRNGTPWFSLLQGVYPDHAAATAARDALPRALRDTGAWPRSFKSVQQEIRKGGR